MTDQTERDDQRVDRPREGRRLSLAGQVLIALALGLVAGVVFGELLAPLKVVGDIFIKLLQISVIPYIVVALIRGIGRLSYREVRELARRGGAVLLVLWGVGIVLLLLLPLSFPDWPSASFFRKSELEAAAPTSFLQIYIPSNPFFSLANSMVPAVVVFSILFGLALTGIERKDVLLEPLSIAGDALMKISGYVSALAPIGVFALIASAAGTMSFEDLGRLQVFLAVGISLLLILTLWVLPALVSCVTPLSHTEIVSRLRAPLITGFATGSALVVLPQLAEVCKELVAEARASTPDDEEEIESSVDVLVPTFFSFPTLGNVMALGFVGFAGWYIGSPVPPGEYLTMLAGGVASMFGGPALAIPFALELVRLPRDLFDVFLSVDVIGSRFSSLLSVMHYATIALIGTFALNRRLRVRLWRVVRGLGVSVVLVAATLVGVHAFYTHVLVVPYTKDEALRGLDLLRRPQPALVYTSADAVPERPEAERIRSYSDVMDSGVLRVCYADGNYPLSYTNARDELVGFDIEMAHRFAERLSVSLEFVPLERLSEAQTRVADGYCDVVFNTMVMSLSRIESAVQTDAFGAATIAFLVIDHRREDFATWERIRALGPIDIAVSAFQSFPRSVVARLPEAAFIPFDSLEDQMDFFESGGEGADAFVDTAEEGAAWTILYPRFSRVVPRPAVSVPVVYLVARENPSLLRALNAWLDIEDRNGGIDELGDYWIEGQIDAVRPPRWSVVRDVLGWVR